MANGSSRRPETASSDGALRSARLCALHLKGSAKCPISAGSPLVGCCWRPLSLTLASISSSQATSLSRILSGVIRRGLILSLERYSSPQPSCCCFVEHAGSALSADSAFWSPHDDLRSSRGLWSRRSRSPYHRADRLACSGPSGVLCRLTRAEGAPRSRRTGSANWTERAWSCGMASVRHPTNRRAIFRRCSHLRSVCPSVICEGLIAATGRETK